MRAVAVVSSCAVLATACGTRLSREEIVAAAGTGTSGGGISAGGVPSGAGGDALADSGLASPDTTTTDQGAVPGATSGSGGGARAAGGGSAAGGAGGGAPTTDISFDAFMKTGPATGEPVNVGIVGPFTGLVGASFGNFAAGLRMWAEWANQHGGLNGHPVRVFSKDDQADPSVSYSAVRSMIEEHNVVALVNNTVVFPGALKAINEAKVPAIGGELISREWFRQPNLFPQGPPLQAGMHGLTAQFMKEGNKKIALYYCSELYEICGPYNDELVKNKYIERAGGTVVDVQAVSLTSPSFTSQCIAARDAGAQAIMTALDVGSNIRFANDCAAQNYRPRFGTFSVAANDKLLNVDNIRNVIVAMPVAPWVANDTPGMAEFHAAVRRFAPNLELGTGMVLTWVSGLTAMAAARLGGMGADPAQAREQLRRGLTQLRNFNAHGTTAPLELSTPGQPRIGDCAFFIERTPQRKWALPYGSAPVCQ